MSCTLVIWAVVAAIVPTSPTANAAVKKTKDVTVLHARGVNNLMKVLATLGADLLTEALVDQSDKGMLGEFTREDISTISKTCSVNSSTSLSCTFKLKVANFLDHVVDDCDCRLIAQATLRWTVTPTGDAALILESTRSKGIHCPAMGCRLHNVIGNFGIALTQTKDAFNAPATKEVWSGAFETAIRQKIALTIAGLATLKGYVVGSASVVRLDMKKLPPRTVRRGFTSQTVVDWKMTARVSYEVGVQP